MHERDRFLRAIKKCLTDAKDYFQKTMDILDEIGKASVGTGMTPLVGGYAMSDDRNKYRSALIELDSAEKALRPLAIRFEDGRVNETHFTNEQAIKTLRDLVQFDYDILIRLLAERKGRESVWYRMKELKEKAERLNTMVASN